MRALAGLLAVSLTLPTADGEQVIRDVHAKYGGTWFKSLTFVQKTTFGDGRIETWYEALQLPGRLRIDYAPMSAGRAIIFRNDSLYAYQGGNLAPARPLQHALLILLYDIHVQDPSKTIAALKSLNFDLSKSHTTTWQGRFAIVVGALAGDTTSSQAWFDAERMVPVRVIQRGAQGSQDIHIGGYVQVGRWWHERDIRFFVNGTMTLHEEYTDVVIDATFPESIFEPAATLTRPAWLGEGKSRWP